VQGITSALLAALTMLQPKGVVESEGNKREQEDKIRYCSTNDNYNRAIEICVIIRWVH
jgi:hypothetical protein